METESCKPKFTFDDEMDFEVDSEKYNVIEDYLNFGMQCSPFRKRKIKKSEESVLSEEMLQNTLKEISSKEESL